ncbi:uncharacterized protein H6S33_004955 [Morchella sextelata]|uniref:uncharacterized protein n=1 Tax=Morchella sextelata TaxID=1174677 RepID=UPI001D037873|nr:uncharacterized protein H6S33_004955 [Morchella sextelata]KAH0604973.1 hypothetical protein H6S33_004955 [Morchella sextelata]
MAVRGDFAKTLKCVRSLIDFHLMAQYGTHPTSTLNYMESYLDDFYKHKDIFLEFQVYKRMIGDAKNRTKALNASGSQSAQRGLEEIREIRERSHFHFIKLHMLSHYREHIEHFRSIPQYSTDISELTHVRQIKEAYGVSNKIDAATQVLDYGGWLLALEIRILNLKDIAGGSDSTDHILWSHRDNLKE